MSPNNAKSHIISDTKWCKIVHSEQQLQYLYKYYTLILNTQYSIVRMYVCWLLLLLRDTSEREWSSFMILKLCYYFMIKRLLLVSICFFFSIAKTSYVFFHALYHHDFHNLVKSGVSGVVVLLRLFGGNNSTYRG